MIFLCKPFQPPCTAQINFPHLDEKSIGTQSAVNIPIIILFNEVKIPSAYPSLIFLFFSLNVLFCYYGFDLINLCYYN